MPRLSKKVSAAKKLFSEFSGHNLDGKEYIITVPDNLVVFPVGKMTGIMYSCVRDGKREKYLHQFNAKSAPLLTVSSDGKQMFIIGGDYQFKDTGFNDLK